MRKPTKRELALRAVNRKRARELRREAEAFLGGLRDMLMQSSGFSVHMTRQPIFTGIGEDGFAEHCGGPTTVRIDINSPP